MLLHSRLVHLFESSERPARQLGVVMPISQTWSLRHRQVNWFAGEVPAQVLLCHQPCRVPAGWGQSKGTCIYVCWGGWQCAELLPAQPGEELEGLLSASQEQGKDVPAPPQSHPPWVLGGLGGFEVFRGRGAAHPSSPDHSTAARWGPISAFQAPTPDLSHLDGSYGHWTSMFGR